MRENFGVSPSSVTSIAVMSIGIDPAAVFGMSSITVSRPRSLWRSSTADWSLIWPRGSRAPAGLRMIAKRAGSPGWGVKLNSDPFTVSGSKPSAATEVLTLPTCVLAGHEPASNCGWVHFGAIWGFPIWPGGRPILMSFTSSPALVNPTWIVKSVLAPACVVVGVVERPVKPSANAEGASASAPIAAPATAMAAARRRLRVMFPWALSAPGPSHFRGGFPPQN